MAKALICLVLLISLGCKPDKNSLVSKPTSSEQPEGMAYIPGATYNQGGKTDQAYNNELPQHKVTVSSFYIDVTEVTNLQFAEFVTATQYKTVAERPLEWEVLKKQLPPGTPALADSLLQPGSLVFKKTDTPVDLRRYDLWWEWTRGAEWRHPDGPMSDISDKMNHPVVHIAYQDAKKYCEWKNKRLPTEAEWEWAATGGEDRSKYPWGNAEISTAYDKANFWQGLFPYENTVKDGYASTAPVKSFPPNSFGLFDMGGNVWEWCSDRFASQYYRTLSEPQINPKGPEVARDENDPYNQNSYVIKGGSFLCNDDYCSGYRVARRLGKDADSGSNHTGFRCVMEIKHTE